MRRSHILLYSLFAIVCLALLPLELSKPVSETFSSDSAQYNAGAVHLATQWFYSIDGATPFLEREPGQSMFMAVIYAVFGVENRVAYFLAQALLHALAAGLFCRTLAQVTNRRVGTICLATLLLMPSVYHIIFSGNRESLALSLLLIIATLLLRCLQAPVRPFTIVGLGVLLGYTCLVYMPFLFLPIVIVGFLVYKRFPWRQALAILFLAYFVVAAWGGRNWYQTGQFALSGSYRTTVMLYVRAEQAQYVRGLEPLRCLWAEYISRDWSERSHACSFNGIANTKWPGRVPTPQDDQIRQESIERIFVFFPNYLWFSVVDIVEYHVPYVNGWGTLYNALTALGMMLLYFGCALAIRVRWQPAYGLFVVIGGYSLLMFILTDATPRYHMPVLFCYAVFCALGYDRFLSRFAR